MLRKEVAGEVNIEQLNKDINRFQSLIGSTQFPVGTHLTGPLRDSLKKVRPSPVARLQPPGRPVPRSAPASRPHSPAAHTARAPTTRLRRCATPER